MTPFERQMIEFCVTILFLLDMLQNNNFTDVVIGDGKGEGAKVV